MYLIMTNSLAVQIYQALSYQPREKEKSLTASEKYFLIRYLESKKWMLKELNIQNAAGILESDRRTASKVLNQLADKGVMLKKANLTQKRGRPGSYYMLSPSMIEHIQAPPTHPCEAHYINYFLEMAAQNQKSSNTNTQPQKELSKGRYLLLLTLVLHADQAGYILGLSKSKMSKHTGLSMSQVKLLLKELLVSLHISELAKGGTDPSLLGKHPSIYKVNRPAFFKNPLIFDLMYSHTILEKSINDRISAISKNIEEQPYRTRQYLRLFTSVLAANLLNSQMYNQIDTDHTKSNHISSDLIQKTVVLYRTQIYSVLKNSKLSEEFKDSLAEKITIDVIKLSISIKNTIQNEDGELASDVLKRMYRIIDIHPMGIVFLEHGEI